MMSVEASKSAAGPEIVSLLEYVYLGLVVKCQPSVNTSGILVDVITIPTLLVLKPLPPTILLPNYLHHVASKLMIEKLSKASK